MNNVPTAPKPNNPRLSDVPIGAFQDILLAKLDWLNYAFGRAQRITSVTDTGKMTYPAAYVESGNYRQLYPDSELGNFSFFFVEDAQEYNGTVNRSGMYKYNTSLVVWFNIEETGQIDRSIEAIKAEIMAVINNDFVSSYGAFRISKIYELAENIYKGFNIDEAEGQYLMYPYFGFRFEGTLSFIETICT